MQVRRGLASTMVPVDGAAAAVAEAWRQLP
jgi:hypothetical protein